MDYVLSEAVNLLSVMPNFDFSRHQKPKTVDARLELTTVSKQRQHPITLQPLLSKITIIDDENINI